MAFQNIFLLALILAIAVLLMAGRVRSDLVAILALVTLALTGLVAPDEIFSGFSRSAVITIMALFIITDALERTGVTRGLGSYLRRLAGESETRAIIAIMAATALLSLVMNTIAAAAVLLPAVIGITRQTDLKPSRLLIPLSFGSLLGGMATLFTTANLLVSSALVEAGFLPYTVFDFIPIGLPMAVVGIAFMALIGRRFLPDHALGGERLSRRGSLADMYGLKDAIHAVYVKPGCALGGLTLAAGGWGQKLGLSVVGISRGDQVMLAPRPTDQILEGDLVLFTGIPSEKDLSHYGLMLTDDPTWKGPLISGNVSLVEIVLAPRSTHAHRTLREISFRERYNLTALSLWREGKTFREAIAEIPLQFGDALLVQGSRDKVDLLRQDPDFIVLDEDFGPFELGLRGYIALILTLLSFLLPAFNILPIAEATFAAATLMILLGCLTMDQAYSAIEWRAIFLIAGMLPIGLAMIETGTASILGSAVVNLFGAWGAVAVSGGIFLLTMLLTQVMSGQATAVVLAPVAIAAAHALGVDPRAVGMAVAMGASMAFMTPFGHPANILVMGPGGYTTKDFARVGIPLTIALFLVFLIALTLFWRI